MSPGKKDRKRYDLLKKRDEMIITTQTRRDIGVSTAGRFVPETLVPRYDELTRPISGFEMMWISKRASVAAEGYVQAVTVVSCSAAELGTRRCKDISQTRRPQSHGAHKINNCGRADSSRPTNGQEPDYRGNGAGQHGVARLLCVLCSDSSVSSTWALRTCGVRR